MLIGTVVAVMAATIVLIRFLDNCYRPGTGSLRPVAMKQTLRMIEKERRIVGDTTKIMEGGLGT